MVLGQLHVIWLGFIAPFPDFAEHHGWVEAIENGERHADVGDDDPRPKSVELQLDGIDVGPGLFQRVNGPHGKVADLQWQYIIQMSCSVA